MKYAVLAVLPVALAIAAGLINYAARRLTASKEAVGCMGRGSFLDVDGVKISYIEKGSGKPLILIHGSQMSLYDWRFNIDEFSKDFKVIALDMVGCGLSDKPGANYSPEYFSEFIGRAMRQLGLSKASFVASSWGGGHVLDFALRHPERVDKLVLSSPCGLPHRMNPTETVLSLPVIGAIAMLFVSKSLVRKQLEHAFEKKELIDDDLVGSVYLPILTKGGIRAVVQAYRHADFSFVRANLNRIQCPVLILWGSEDRIHARWMMDEFLGRIAGARLHVIGGVGHMPHEEAPVEFNRAAYGFLAS